MRSGEADRVVWSIVINGPISIMEGRDTKSLVGGITGYNPYGTILNLLNRLIYLYYLILYLHLCLQYTYHCTYTCAVTSYWLDESS